MDTGYGSVYFSCYWVIMFLFINSILTDFPVDEPEVAHAPAVRTTFQATECSPSQNRDSAPSVVEYVIWNEAVCLTLCFLITEMLIKVLIIYEIPFFQHSCHLPHGCPSDGAHM